MCLKTVDLVTKTYTEGWKVFNLYEDGLHPSIRYCGKSIPANKWISDKNAGCIINSGSPLQYPTGFHFYVNKSEAEKSATSDRVVRKIMVRRVVATGGQEVGYNLRIVDAGVAEEMYIVRKWYQRKKRRQ